ncbi:40-residue YVTN family beta-propeller repeat protein [Rubrivivax sp. A210]|uniref:YncE family protein n=1 Tax=Rubrivivax sp. A210 TaxID=2772301 RepID=UPI0019187B1F|nr:YncE family protein [Rubrivivax sp. A210]CAD5372146.1 40-residue YVTN family beta-propeller repeat protein [Rubrivivax sp. A210]
MHSLRAALCTALALAALAVPACAAPFAYITNQGSHDVSVIDLASERVVATVPVGRSPAGVAAASRIARVFVSNPDSKTLSVIDMRSQRVVDTWPAGSGPVGIAASADGQWLYVADWYANRLLIYATAGAGRAEPAIALGQAPAGVAVHDNGRLVFVAERDDDSVAVIDTRERRVRARVRVGSHPFALLHDAARERLYALNVQSNDVSVVDTRDADRPAVIATVAVGKAPYGAALAMAGSLLYITNQHEDSVSVIDTATLRLLRTLPGFAYPEGVAAHGDKVYVVNWMDDNVSVLDAASGRTLAQVATGSNSRGFGAFIGAPEATP